MNRYLFILLFLLSGLAGGSQSVQPVKDNIACLWGFKNDAGAWVIQPKYTLVENSVPGYYLVMFNEKRGLLDMDGREVLAPGYDRISPSEYDNYGTKAITELVACKDSLCGLINLRGKVLIPFVYEAIWKSVRDTFYNVGRRKKYGTRTISKEILPCIYPQLKRVEGTNLFVAAGSDNLYSAENTHSGNNLGVISTKGDTIIPCRFDAIKIPGIYGNTFHDYPDGNVQQGEALIEVTLHSFSGLYTFDGVCVMEPKYTLFDYLYSYMDGVWQYSYHRQSEQSRQMGVPVLITENNKFGFFTPGKGLVQKPDIDSISRHYNSHLVPPFYKIYRKGKYGLLNMDGTEKLPCKYRSIDFFRGLVIVSEKKDKYKQYDWKNNKVKPNSFDKILPVTNSYVNFVKGKEIYTSCFDTAIHKAPLRAMLPGGIRIFNRGDAVKGRGKNCVKVPIKGLNLSRSFYYEIESDAGTILCDSRYRVVLPAGAYHSFHDVEDSPNIAVVTKAKKVGLIDSAGKLILDTIYEAIGTHYAKGLYSVKILNKQDSMVSGRCTEGWALADSTGRLITEAIFRTPGVPEYYARIFEFTKDGVGIFDFHERRFVTPTNCINGFFTGDGSSIMQTRDSLFEPFSRDGRHLSKRAWPGLLHVSGEYETERYTGYSAEDGSFATDTTKATDSWLFIDKDSLALLSAGRMELNKKTILRTLYNFFSDADARDFERGVYDFYGYQKPFAPDCPRLDSGQERSPWSFYTVIDSSGMTTQPKDTVENTINDSLVMYMIRRIAPSVKYPLYPNHEYNCSCIAFDYSEGNVYAPDDRRQIDGEPETSGYFRIVYRNKSIISLQILDDFANFDYGNQINKKFGNRSVFENYRIDNGKWTLLQLKDLFKPGFEKLLLPEIVRSIQNADSLELDCSNPNSYVEQCRNRFSVDEKGLWVYVENRGWYEFSPLFIPWKRLLPVIPVGSVIYGLTKYANNKK